mmetsp:Transcript_35728/g.60209  ORF Transcript_35728/g.60209 Transcript_35728/m.60209 type:complete len:300 (-) Transcript_35728:640-1539(-)
MLEYFHIVNLLGLHPKHRGGHVENLRRTFAQHLLPRVVPTPFQKQPVDVHPRRRARLVIFGIHAHDVKVVVHRVDGDVVGTRKVLQRGGHEGGREEKARDPENCRGGRVVPRLQHAQTVQQLVHVPRDPLEAREGHPLPQFGHRPDGDGFEHRLQLSGHHQQTLDGLLQRLQTCAHHVHKLVVAQHLLAEHLVEALLVQHRELVLRDLHVERRRQPLQRVLHYISHHFFFTRARPAPRSRASQHERRQQLTGLTGVFGNVGVVVQAECFRGLRGRQRHNGLQVFLPVAHLRDEVDARAG